MKRALVFLLAGVAGCASPWERLDPARLPTAAAYPDAPAVVLLDETSVRFVATPLGDPVAEVTRHKRIAILRTEGQPRARIAIRYDNLLSPLVSFAARTRSPDGSERRFGRGDASDMAAIGKTLLYDDDRLLVLDPPATPGTIVEWRAQLRYTDVHQSLSHSFGGDLPTVEARLTVSAPSDWRIEHQARRLDEDLDFRPVRADRFPISTATWERRDLPALPVEQAAPPSDWLAPSVRVRLLSWTARDGVHHAFRTPDEMSAWMHRLARDTDQPSPELIAQTTKLLDGARDPRDKAARLYSFARDGVHYCAVEIGYGGWRPHLAGDVLRYRYGDCKDKANLLRALLGIAGIPSRLVEITSHHGYPKPFGMPSLGGFNHMILAVDLPDGMVLADPTSRAAPFGRLPTQDEDAEALPQTEKGDPLLRTPSAAPEQSVSTTKLTLALAASGPAGATFELSQTGHFADRFRLDCIAQNDPRVSVGDALGLRGLKIDRFEIRGKAPTVYESPIVATGAGSLPDALHGSGSTRLVRLSDFVARALPSLSRGARSTPVVLGFRSRRVETIDLVLPEGVAPPSLPAEVALDTDFARYRLSWRLDGRRIEVVRDLTVAERAIPVARYADLTRLIEAIDRAEATGIVLHL